MDNEKTQIFRDFSKIENNKNLINTHLERTGWATELQVNLSNADLSSDLFFIKIEQLINFWAPLQRVSNKKKKLQNKPWVIKGLLKPAETKNRLFKTWEGIGKIINITAKGSKEINSIQVGNKTISNPTKIANSFNNHFTSSAEKIEDNLVKSKFSYSKYLSNPNEYSVFIKPTNAEEVLCEINKLKNKKSIGLSNTPLKFLNFFKTTLSEPISLIANISFQLEPFPLL